VSDRIGVVSESAEMVSAMVQALGEELATFRQRALKAEARVKELEAAGAADADELVKRLQAAESENAELKSRIDTVTPRLEALMEQAKFARQQEVGGEVR
jgi:ribosome assembly protein YihI (activator of Der GTPase)